MNRFNFLRFKRKIDQEILNSMFFSWQVDETTDISCQSQLTVIFRYVHEDKVVERFMDFFDVSSERIADGLFKLLVHKYKKFSIGS